MEQHPIPQNISSYQFRLVGDMTLKQFLQVAAGCLISLLIYSTPLHPVIKWPLILFFVSLGAALAFLPFQERPLEKWIIAFFRSVYSPTMYFWRPITAIPIFFQPEPSETGQTLPTMGVPKTGEGSFAFLSSLDEAEKTLLEKISGLFASAPIPPPAGGPAAQGPTQTPQAKPPELVVPSIQPTYIAPQGFQPKVIVQEVRTQTPVQEAPATNQASLVGQTLMGQAPSGATAAQFSLEAAPPIPPTQPNIIVGQTLDASGKIIDAAILEIRDEQGRPVRALKSNKAGHFMIVTPLLNGKYEIIVEKDGVDFAPLTIAATGNIIPPIALRSKNSILPS